MRWILFAGYAMLAGCATLDGGSKTIAENTCHFAFLATVPIAGTLFGAAFCSYGVEEFKEKKSESPEGGYPG